MTDKTEVDRTRLKESEEEWPYLSKGSTSLGSEMQTPEEMVVTAASFETQSVRDTQRLIATHICETV